MDKVKFLMSSIWEFLLPLIRVLMTNGGEVLAKAASDSVRIVAVTCTDKTGAEKREVAFKMILATLTAAGITLSKTFVNAALEAAVVKMKEK